jgi:hypothetical protein
MEMKKNRQLMKLEVTKTSNNDNEGNCIIEKFK